MNWVQINIQVNEYFRYMKIHIFALRFVSRYKNSKVKNVNLNFQVMQRDPRGNLFSLLYQ